ncbi:VIT1/CCC1 transporter family protein [Candidatus Woesearchaeota archaeon]|nr:VIT1/CCC1 transporter family protein [Candidatus Woesearchaeota archaeon]
MSRKLSRTERARRAFDTNDVALARKAHGQRLIERHIHEQDRYATRAQYLGEFVYGALDGTVTTFAIVAGAAGAMLTPGIVIILGFSNLIADGFSMASGNYLSERTQQDYIAKERKREEWEVEHVPDGEKREVREIFRQKGFAGKDLDRAVEIITSDKKVWIDTMMADELGLIESAKSPWKTAMATYIGFILIGVIPLLAYVLSFFLPIFRSSTFLIAIGMTLAALVTIGVIKRYVTKKELWKSVLETVAVGGVAAFIAYYVGYFLRLVVGAVL